MKTVQKGMEPLVTNRHVLTWLCLYPAPKGVSPYKRMGHILFSGIVFGANVSYLVVSFIFLLKHIRVDLREAFFAIYQVAGMIAPIYCTIIAYFSRHNMLKIFNGLAKVYNESEYYSLCKLSFLDAKSVVTIEKPVIFPFFILLNLLFHFQL